MNRSDLPYAIQRRTVVLNNGCWAWLGNLGGDRRSRPVIYWEGRQVAAPRLVYRLLIDPAFPVVSTDRDDQLDHVAELCPNRPNCVNPAHLEPVTCRENVARYRQTTDKTSRYTGVRRHRNKWRAEVFHDGRQRHLGNFDTEHEAADAYDAALIALGLAPINLLARIGRNEVA